MRHHPSLPVLLALAAVSGASLHAQEGAYPKSTETTSTQSTPAQGPTAQTPAAPPTSQQGGTVTGTVIAAVPAAVDGKSQPGTPLPGVSITATNSLTGKKYAAATDSNGTFRLLIPRNGRYVLRTEFAGFAPVTAEVLLNDSNHAGRSEFSLELASRAVARAAQAGATSEAAAALGSGLGLTGAQTQALQRGLQSLRGSGSDAEASSDSSGSAGASLTNLPGIQSSGADSVAITGQSGQTNGLAGFNEDEVRDRIESAVAEARRNGGQQADIANAVVGLVGSMMGGPGGFGEGGGGRPGGGPGGGGGGPFRIGAGGGRGGFRSFNPTQIHGNLFYQGGNGALDATQFSLTGDPIQPAYSTNRFGLNLTGSPYLPGLLKPSSKQFGFINITGQRNQTPTNIAGTVPGDALRTGDFSGFTRTVSGAATPVVIFDPLTGAPFGCASAAVYAANPGCATNVIPANRINQQALALLSYYPRSNEAPVTGNNTGEVYNYQRVTTAGQNQLQISARFIRNFGATPAGRGAFGGMFGGGGSGRGNRQQPGQKPTLRQNINTNFSYSHSGNDVRNFAPALDGKTFSDGINAGVGYSFGYGRFNSNASIAFNRSHATTQNLFTGTAFDPGANLGIPKPASIAPGFYNGVPTVGLTNFNSLADSLPADRLQQTFSFGDQVRWNHNKHNLNVGFDARRVQNNVIGSTNVLGAFTFSGVYTQDPSASTTTNGSTGSPTGSSFADFLLGAPQRTSIQAGLNKIHLRETVVNAYGYDDYRVLPNLTLNLGLRYEYFSPYYETDNQLVNLDHSADFTTVAPVLPNATGPYGGTFPRSLVNPDRTLLSPRLGLAWRPKGNSNFVKNTVVRAGYGINYNTTAFGSFANSLSYQTPFAVTQTNIASLPGSNDGGCGTFTTPGIVNRSTFTLNNAFNCTAKAVTNNFAINRDYRLGRVQVLNFGIQHTFGFGILLNVDYNGSLGSHLDILRAPGATPDGLATTNAQAYTFEDSIADSRSNALFVSARKRMSRGISMQATYTYGHGIDNASTLSGGGGTVAQNYQRLDLEYGNSSFDVRHRATGNWVLELPFGENRAFLNKGGWLSYALNGFNVSGDFTFATGSYATPQYQNTAAQLVTGGNYTLRPDRVFTQRLAGAGTLRNWFNTDAFAEPTKGAFGTSSRNSIQLPGTVSVDSSLGRSFAFGDLKNFEVRATATNVFNTVQYSGVNTVLNSATFGQVSSVAQARRLSFQARYRF